jgi:hypothetical protein
MNIISIKEVKYIFIGYTSPINVLGNWPHPMCYVPQLIKEYAYQLTDKCIRFFYRLPVLTVFKWGASKIGHKHASQVLQSPSITTKQLLQFIDKTTNKSLRHVVAVTVGSSRVQNGVGEVGFGRSVVMRA